MKSQSFDNANKFFETIKSVGFFERLFAWNNITKLSYDAYEEFKSVDKSISNLTEQVNTANQEVKDLKKDLDHKKEEIKKIEIELGIEKKNIDRNNKDLQEKEKELGKLQESDKKNSKRISELDAEVQILKSQKDSLQDNKVEIEKKLKEFQTTEKKKQDEYEHKVTELNSVIDRLDKEKQRLQNEREEEIKSRFEEMKLTWKKHEFNVEEIMKSICQKNQIEYIDKESVPFKGKPDNTVKICEEYIIFDAKSPQSDDLSNFPTYVKTQAESVKKYIKEKDVKKDVFLVVPANTLEKLQQFYYNMADYNVFVLSNDSLEPVILSLKKIEEYEFAEQLSPEDRDNICRVIGKFAHATKRRIQVDNYFSNEFMGILSNCSNLPSVILEKAIDYEKSDKMNPPVEKRAKAISNSEITKETKRIKQEAQAKDIEMDVESDNIEKIPLYK